MDYIQTSPHTITACTFENNDYTIILIDGCTISMQDYTEINDQDEEN